MDGWSLLLGAVAFVAALRSLLNLTEAHGKRFRRRLDRERPSANRAIR